MFTGIRSLLGSGVYTEAYPLHDVGNIIILLFFMYTNILSILSNWLFYFFKLIWLL